MGVRRDHIIMPIDSDALQQLRTIHDLLQQSQDRSKVELNVCIRSSQLINSEVMRSVVAGLKPNICLLRLMHGAHTFTTQFFPMTNVQTLELEVPTKPTALAQFQAALQQLPQLHDLHIFTRSSLKAHHIKSSCSQLANIPQVNELKIAAGALPICVPGAFLCHITLLQLSSRATFDMAPPDLRKLIFTDIRDREDLPSMAEQLGKLRNMACIGADTYSVDALL